MGPIHGWESSFFHSYHFFAVSISEFTDGVIANLGGLVYGICFVLLGEFLSLSFCFGSESGFLRFFILLRPLGFAHDFMYSGLRLQLAFVIRYQLALALVISIIRRRPVHFAI